MKLSQGAKLVIRFFDSEGKPIADPPRVNVSDLSDPVHRTRNLVPHSNNEPLRRVLGKTTVSFGYEEVEFLAKDGDTIYRDFCIEPNGSIGTYVQNPANGHYYLATEGATGQFSFAEALEFAASARYRGLQGHLVTIGSKQEDQFLFKNFRRRGYTWAGATDEETEGVWKWVCGPENGKIFFQLGKPTGAYHNWARDSYHVEPNNMGRGEHFLLWNWRGGWNDWDIDRAVPYVLVEFSPTAADGQHTTTTQSE